jgi:1-acyl-sn-glycerol-3-phosphate acyltransferase
VAFHDYRVIGLEHIPTEGPALIVFTHSLATYDIFLLGATLFLEKKRLIVSLADRLIFKTPLLADAARFMSAVPGDPTVARQLLDEGRLLGVAPGGMREALRPSTHRYTLDWKNRTGFAKLALEAKVPVVLAACPRADDLYDVFDNAATRFIYERFRFPLPLIRGRGLLPRKVPLVHMVSEPITPPALAGSVATREESAAFAAQLTERMERLIQAALAAEKSTAE